MDNWRFDSNWGCIIWRWCYRWWWMRTWGSWLRWSWKKMLKMDFNDEYYYFFKWVKVLVMVGENGWHWTKWMKMVAESWFWFIITWRIENRWHDHDHHLNPSGGVWTSSSYTGVVPRPPSLLHQQLIHKTIACNITNWCISNFSMQYDTIPSNT